MELLNKQVPKDSTAEVIDETKDVDPADELKDDPADDAAGHNLRQLAKVTRLEEVTLCVPGEGAGDSGS